MTSYALLSLILYLSLSGSVVYAIPPSAIAARWDGVMESWRVTRPHSYTAEDLVVAWRLSYHTALSLIEVVSNF